MKVKRIVANVVASDVAKASAFYEQILGLERARSAAHSPPRPVLPSLRP